MREVPLQCVVTVLEFFCMSQLDRKKVRSATYPGEIRQSGYDQPSYPYEQLVGHMHVATITVCIASASTR